MIAPIGVAFAVGCHFPERAKLIDYTYSGAVSSENGSKFQDYLGRQVTTVFRVDTSACSVFDGSFDLQDKGV